MYRVRFPTGEEAAFRSVEELALGIHSGVINGQAEIYHSHSAKWLPITVHPEFAAAEQAAARVAGSEHTPAPPTQDSEVEILLQGKVPIYKMHSLSAKEIEARRRPWWITPAMLATAVVILAGAVSLASALGGGGGDVANARPNTAFTFDRLPAFPLPKGRRAAAAADAAAPGHPGPDILARNAARAKADAARVLGQVAGALGLHDLVSQRRLRTPDSLRAVRQAVAAFAPAVERWRDDEHDVLSAYRDSAAALTHSGRWNPAEFTEWRVRAPIGESLTKARATDSLLQLLDRAYALIEASDEVDSSGSPRIDQPKAAREYDEIRTAIVRLTSDPIPGGERTPAPLVILRSGLGGHTFPPRTSR